MKTIKLKTQCRFCHCQNDHIARVIGRSCEFDFEREIITRADLGWHAARVALVDQPGLYEIQNCATGGCVEKCYIVFDGKNRGEISFEEALSLTCCFKKAKLNRFVKTALHRDRQKRKANRLRKKELCLWMLDAAQKMQQLESRTVTRDLVVIDVRLPIKVIPHGKPGWVGFRDPTLCGRASIRRARIGTPEGDLLMSKTLNKLTHSELEQVAKPMCKAYSENAMIQRVFAVIDHAASKEFDNLQKLVDLTKHFDPECSAISKAHYHRFLRLAVSKGCLLSLDQITQLL